MDESTCSGGSCFCPHHSHYTLTLFYATETPGAHGRQHVIMAAGFAGYAGQPSLAASAYDATFALAAPGRRHYCTRPGTTSSLCQQFYQRRYHHYPTGIGEYAGDRCHTQQI